jgi:hypothetical protein
MVFGDVALSPEQHNTHTSLTLHSVPTHPALRAPLPRGDGEVEDDRRIRSVRDNSHLIPLLGFPLSSHFPHPLLGGVPVGRGGLVKSGERKKDLLHFHGHNRSIILKLFDIIGDVVFPPGVGVFGTG